MELIRCQHLTLKRARRNSENTVWKLTYLILKYSSDSYSHHRVKSEQLQRWRTVLISACSNTQWRLFLSLLSWPFYELPTAAQKKTRREQRILLCTVRQSEDQPLPCKHIVIYITQAENVKLAKPHSSPNFNEHDADFINVLKINE